VNALVIGDIMLDRSVRGEATRISPEAPVPVIDVEEQSELLGGAANVARNLASLGAGVRLSGIVGNDIAGEQILKMLHEQGINAQAVQKSEKRPTTVKTRVYGGHQQIIRFDLEDPRPINEFEINSLLDAVDLKDEGQIVILQDYAKGIFRSSLFDRLLDELHPTSKLFVDPSARNTVNWKNVFAIKPNWPEACQAAGISLADASVEEVVETLQSKWSADHLLITRGEKGMVYCNRDSKPIEVPVTPREVFDVSGAGDTSLAIFALCLGCGMDGPLASRIANAAASLVVGKRGTSSLQPDELFEICKTLNVTDGIFDVL